MSFKTGHRARAHKVTTKRRLRRSQIRLLRRLATPAKEAGAHQPEAITKP